MIIWLASYPRSGNTFFRMLLHYTCGLKTYSIYNDPLFDRLEASDAIGHEPLPAPIQTLDRADEPYFVKTHDVPADDRPAIYLVRDGRDALVSFARFLQSFEQPRGHVKGIVNNLLGRTGFHTTLKNLITGRQRYGGWSGNVHAWLNRPAAAHTRVIRYEDLVAQPEHVLGQAMEGFGISMSAHDGQSMPDMASLHARWPQFFRKGRAGSWREEMPPELHELFWRHHERVMVELGYDAEIAAAVA